MSPTSLPPSWDGLLATLHRSPHFAACPESLRRFIAQAFVPRDLAAGTTIKGNAGLFLVEAGTVKHFLMQDGTSVPRYVGTSGPGDAFCRSLPVFAAEPAAVDLTSVTAEAVRLWAIGRPDFLNLCTNNPDLLAAIADRLLMDWHKALARPAATLLDPKAVKVSPALETLLPAGLIRHRRVLPVRLDAAHMVLAMVDPADLATLDEVRRLTGVPVIVPRAVSAEAFEQLARQLLSSSPGDESPPPAADLFDQDLFAGDVFAEGGDEGPALPNVTDLAHLATDPPIIRLANNILAIAIQRSASDIHLEPQENGLLLRYRIDGLLHEERLLPKRVQASLTSRFKIIAGMDIAERRLPQDGRIGIRTGDTAIDLRVNIVPVKHGEKLVMRLLDKSKAILGLDALIGHPQTLERVREMIRQPYGIILVTGPTGSGKTTTLYAALSELNTPDVNIATVEDPIEYELPRVNQVQVKKEIGLDFAQVLRAFLRQDPDIILVGETRDLETAKTAVEASLTGHLVFTTLHTNSAAASFTRLTEMGIEPFLTANATIGIIAQRLVRRLCRHCRSSYEADAETRAFLRWPDDMAPTLYRAAGCERCGQSGYKGRAGIYEVLRMDRSLRKMVAQGAETLDLHAAAVADGMLELRAYALYLLAEGVTSVEEVLSAVAMHD